ncbi:MAG TPA: hypothetical protein VFI09_10825 [Solirubrobacterales bacterium]|nr:hypothetical protein [Solirubrobacterales bacterium]
MKRATSIATILIALAALPPAAGAAEFDKYAIADASVSLSDTQAGAHPDLTLVFDLSENAAGEPYAKARDVELRTPAGFIGNPTAVPECTALQFGAIPDDNECPQDSQIGSIDIKVVGAPSGTFADEPIYNMAPLGSQEAARFGFFAALYPVFVNVRLDPETHELVESVEAAPTASALVRSTIRVWGVPGDSSHDPERITPEEAVSEEAPPGGRESGLPDTPFLTNPTSCEAGRQVSILTDSYQEPSVPRIAVVPFPQISGCGLVGFNPATSLKPTTTQASSATGLDYELSLPAKGLEHANLLYDSELERAQVTLPEGLTVNPSEASGLGVCSQADLARETYDSAPNVGCPESSKIGNLSATSPVLDRSVEGSLYLAKPYENPFGSLLALYMVMKVPDRGVLVKLSGEVRPDPASGQLLVTFDDVPQLPVADFHLHFREGSRAPLITPRTCGSYTTASTFTPWASPASSLTRLNAFQVESGPDHGPCPAGGTPPFEPGFQAGTESNAAGSFSPVDMRLTRRDGDQDITRFSATLPEGLAGVLAGLTQCPDSAIAQARGRTGQNGGHEELANPSCPASSELGHVLAGAGVGDVLTWAEGKIYLAGPYNGAPLSVVAIVPAVAGPFDVGTVVTREALRVDPRTAQVEVDGSASDPIPHILAGIPLTVRDLRVHVDRPRFTYNPTSCEPLSVEATAWGGGSNVFSSLDDSPHGLSERFQAADCAALGFKPRLGLTLKGGGTRRGGHPALTGVYRPRKGNANLKKLVLRLPHSAFLDQAHIRTICTRVQFAAGAGNGADCPKGAVYGHVTVFTPVLDEPLKGSVYLRSSNHNLPDFVAAVHGLVDIEVVARIDSVHGGIRATFTNLPDAPLSKVVVRMQGGKKGLIINSKNLCFKAKRNRANAAFEGHNGRRHAIKPVVRAVGCGKAHRRHRGRVPR